MEVKNREERAGGKLILGWLFSSTYDSIQMCEKLDKVSIDNPARPPLIARARLKAQAVGRQVPPNRNAWQDAEAT